MYPICKRILAIIISGIAIVVLSPILLLIALAIKLDSRGPVLFKQNELVKQVILYDL